MHTFKSLLVMSSLALLAGCGGGSDSSTAAPSTIATPAIPSAGNGSASANITPSSNPPTGSAGSSDSGNSSSPASTGTATPPAATSITPSTAASNTPTAFAATVTQAPADGATINGTVRILVEGSGIENVELLPVTGYAPLIARGIVTGDKAGAFIDFNTTVVPDGQITLRVAGFNMPFGQDGSEITAMPARTWTVKNSTTPAFSAQLVNAPPDGTFLGFDPYSSVAPFVVSGTGLENVELISATNEGIIYERFTISPDKTRATLDWRFYNLRYGSYNLRVVAWDVPPGQSGRRIEVMPPHRYTVHLPLGCQGEGTCGGVAP